MGLTKQKIENILENRGYRAVFDKEAEANTDSTPSSEFAEARSPRLEVLQRRYSHTARSAAGVASRTTTGETESDLSSRDEARRAVPAPSAHATRGAGAIVLVEPLNGRGMRKAMVLSEEGEILGEQG